MVVTTVMEQRYITLAHGGGGQLTAELIEQVILPALGGQRAGQLTDAAVLAEVRGRLAFTTDTYTVQPWEFPGGDIGKLAIYGTVNDLAVTGARPLAISMGLVIQEGFEIESLRRVLTSAGAAARRVGVEIVTGDTKVVPRGACDGLIINTTGLGQVHEAAQLDFERVAADDEVVLSGPLGEHAMAVMSCREGLGFSAELDSDCAPVYELALSLLEALGPDLHWMRDPTRGGLAATLSELSGSAGVDIEIDESSIPVNPTARAAAEMLGLDLLSAANEGKLVAVVAAGRGREAVQILRENQIGRQAAVVGRVAGHSQTPLVEMITSVGGRRIVQMPYGEDLPRIC